MSTPIELALSIAICLFVKEPGANSTVLIGYVKRLQVFFEFFELCKQVLHEAFVVIPVLSVLGPLLEVEGSALFVEVESAGFFVLVEVLLGVEDVVGEL